jgi:ABC-type transporter Mla maintaining outer membrane lipid asymmetry ATPase subunit MlaF
MRAYQMGDRIGILKRSPHGALYINAGDPKQAQASTDPNIQQFLKGLTHGPLTENTEGQLSEAKKKFDILDPFFHNITERVDVDLF